jgi:hypothetical protein
MKFDVAPDVYEPPGMQEFLLCCLLGRYWMAEAITVAWAPNNIQHAMGVFGHGTGRLDEGDRIWTELEAHEERVDAARHARLSTRPEQAAEAV